MRTISTDQDAILNGKARAEYVKVEVTNSSGTYCDLSTYPGFNAVDSVQVSENIDDPHATATVTLKREMENFSISPFMQDAAANRGFVPAASYSPLLDIGRKIKISFAVVPADQTPQGTDYALFFHGYIDTIDSASNEQVTLECRDLGAKLTDTFIERERVYCIASSGQGARMWEPNTHYDIGEYVIPTQSKLNGHYYQVTADSTVADDGVTAPEAEPGDPGAAAWPTGGGSTVVNGDLTFTEVGAATFGTGYAVQQIMQKILDDNGVSATLYTPTSPGWNIMWFKQQRESVMEAIRALANQIGWDVRYKWRSGTAQYELTLFGQERAAPVVARTFGASEYESINSLRLDIAGIRNAVRIVYSDASDTWPDGTPKRREYIAEDATSITDFGRRFMEVAESSASNIDSDAEAQTMGDAILADLKDPVFEKEVALVHGFPWVELGDYYTFSANGRHYDTDQSLAVVSYTHEYASGRMKTRLQVRGAPAGGYARWHAMDARQRPEDVHQTSVMVGGAVPTVTTSQVVGGQRIRIGLDPDKNSQYPVEWEIHMSTSSGFTADNTTLKTITRSLDTTIADLIPGTTYYVKVVPLTRNGTRLVRGTPTAQTSFTAARGSAGHLKSDVNWAQLPLNGGFETQLDASAPPDHWNVTAGAWSTNFSLVADGNGLSSGSYLQATASSTTATIETDFFPIIGNSASAGSAYLQISAWMKRVAGTSGSSRMSLKITTYTYDQASIATTELGVFTGTGSTSWFEYGNEFLPETNARWAKLSLVVVGNAETFTAYIDNVSIERKRSRPGVAEDQTASAANTTSGTFATLRTITFTQLHPASRIVAFFNTSAYAAAVADKVEFRLLRNGSSQGTRTFCFNNINIHHTIALMWEFQGEATTGPYTLAVEWRLSSGTRIDIDSSDSMSLIAFEVR